MRRMTLEDCQAAFVLALRCSLQHDSYARAAAVSMHGDHGEISQFIVHLLEHVKP